MPRTRHPLVVVVVVSVLFSEPKIPQCSFTPTRRKSQRVSVLFSEPKIPQLRRRDAGAGRVTVSVLFSEPKIPQLWRSISRRCARNGFQCSSASRKFLNLELGSVWEEENCRFQCSSASRKFLNYIAYLTARASSRSFSALQRAENSSISASAGRRAGWSVVSVLFSEPKIPQ